MSNARWEQPWQSQRQRTAIGRQALSAPVRQAFADGLLEPGTVLDYGSGRGQDVERLAAAGVVVRGWDPYYAASTPLEAADHVLLSYVLNVIESPHERRMVLEHAWGLALRTLVVASRLSWEQRKVRGDRLSDGVLTSRDTFQHLYEPSELRTLVQDVTHGACLFPAPGVVYVFRNERDRLACLARRTVERFAWQSSEGYGEALQDVVRFYEQRGRLPLFEELPVDHVPLLTKVPMHVLRRSAKEAANPARVEDGVKRSILETLLLLGIAIFDGRPRLSMLPPTTQADLRSFFSSYADACRRADRLLLKLRDDSYLRAVMRNSVGKLTPSALYVHRSAVTRLPVLLRLYEHCAAVAAGRPEGWTLVKLHHDGRKVSWLSYPDFDRDPHPRLSWSYQVDLRTLATGWTGYEGAPNRPLLHRKHEFIADDHADAGKYRRLTEAEVRAGLYRHPELIGRVQGWESELRAAGVQLRGHRLIRKKPS
ncbi:DNA phosphorothioation-associated putative methyltransferase [Friedmanniella luteola]|uniref:DNA phosphorothioation-associated putative methyltransferase n=1 Tax=Friedmanniella luteola TaxID=546871 RepID=A0A1H1ZM71_9ACTN|nr:DNA phosphorothioation-associated putative methyltransferase [Friedmanniella luteola]SDT34905.1 DNA phosphorothioation-associated putative methyltransferase [Friedmanniella luteola]